MAPNFANAKIYCLRDRKNGDKIVYVGSTVRSLSERMGEHRRGVTKNPNYKIYQLMASVGVEHFHIELLADFPCERKEQLHAEEGKYIRLHHMVGDGTNVRIAGRTHKESSKAYREANAEAEASRQKAYREANTETVAAYHKTYREANAEDLAARRKAYLEANAEAVAARKKAYRAAKKAAAAQPSS